jgi:hypothetical protein
MRRRRFLLPSTKSVLQLAGLAVGFIAISVIHDSVQARPAAPQGNGGRAAVETGSVTSGLAVDRRPVQGVPAACPQPVMVQPDVFPVTVGTITSEDGRKWSVPAPVNEGAMAVNVFDTCVGTGDNPNWASQLQTVVVDKDGVEITAFIHADNYFELYVNGQFVARDPVPMTPFNTNVVRFRARYPMTYAIMGVDWETHPGVGMEYGNYNIGDAGFTAYFSDGNGTHADWRAETFYVAPLDDPSCVRITPAGRDSSFCSQAVRPVCAQKDPKLCKALHFTIPSDWTSPKFDDSRWPAAIIWPASAVTDQQAYTGYTKLFGNAEFIWTRNLRLDNLVLARYTAKAPRK